MFTPRAFLGEFLLGLFLVGAFIYGTLEMNRGGARAVQFQSLRERVAKHVDEHPEQAAVTLDDLLQAGVLSPADVDFLARNGIAYQPIAGDAPGHAICFVQRRATEETRYRKDGRSEHFRHWLSPNQAHAVTSAPKPDSAKERTIVVVEQATGKKLLELDAQEASASEVFWSADSRFAAVTTHRYGSAPFVHYMDCGFLIEVGPKGARALDVPAGLRPDQVIPAEHAGKETLWSEQCVMIKGWRGNTLLVECEGKGRILGGNVAPDLWIMVNCRFEVTVADGQARITKQTQQHYKELVSVQ